LRCNIRTNFEDGNPSGMQGGMGVAPLHHIGLAGAGW